MMKWISVKDRLPEFITLFKLSEKREKISNPVIAWTDSDYWIVMSYKIDPVTNKPMWVTGDNFDKEIESEVTHWVEDLKSPE